MKKVGWEHNFTKIRISSIQGKYLDFLYCDITSLYLIYITQIDIIIIYTLPRPTMTQYQTAQCNPEIQI